MVALIKTVWSDDRRSSIIAIDERTQRIVKCYVWMDSTKNRLIASLCERAESNGTPAGKIPVVLTLAPPNAMGWHRVEEAELMPHAEAV